MPTPPPWWRETQVAPDAVLRRALSSAQSDTTSLPSFMLSVSRFGEATLPLSRWSRPITMGAETSPFRTISLNARPRRWRWPRPTQQMRAGRPWKAMRSRAMSSPRWRGGSSGGHVERAVKVRVVGDQLFDALVSLVDVLGIAAERDPAERADAAAEERADVSGDEAGEVEGVGNALLIGFLADVVAVIEGRHAHRLEGEHRLDVARHGLLRR